MKKITTFVLALVLGAFVFTACDKVEGPFYELINQEDVTVTFPDIDQAAVYRKMLVEEFTGHRCTNCPQGHQILENLHEQYGDTLVTVGIHFGLLAKPTGSLFSYDFRTEAGDQIGEAYAIDAIPAAIMNRNDKAGGWMRDQWANVIHDIDRSQVPAAVQLINEYDDASMTLKANVKVTLFQDCANPLRLVVFVIEDGIVKPQKDGNQDIEEYVHNHVLRAALTDPFGFPLRNNEAWTAGDTETYAVSVGMANTDWEPGNCSVVAFLFDPINNDVLQVEQVAVK